MTYLIVAYCPLKGACSLWGGSWFRNFPYKAVNNRAHPKFKGESRIIRTWNIAIPEKEKANALPQKNTAGEESINNVEGKGKMVEKMVHKHKYMAIERRINHIQSLEAESL